MITRLQTLLEEARIIILGMSNPRSKSIRKIEGLAEPIMIHLALVAAYPRSTYQKHWRAEITSFMKRVRYYQLSCKVDIPDSVVLQLIYEHPLGSTKDKSLALELAKDHMERGFFMKPPEADEENYLAFPFEETFKSLIKNPSYLR